MTAVRRPMNRFCLVSLWLALLTLVLADCGGAEVRTVQLPMRIDMPLLRTLIVNQAYADPGERAKVLVMSEGCNEVWLSDPEVEPDDDILRFATKVHITWGTPMAGNCFAPLTWEGSVVLWQEPEIDEQWRLRFHTLNSAILDVNGRPVKVVSLLWDLIKDHVHVYLSRIALNLAPPVENVKQFLLPETAENPKAAANRFLASMRPQKPVLEGDRLRVDILAEADLTAPEESGMPPVASPEALARVLDLWQTWDAMLVHLIDQLSDKPLSEDDRQLLLDTMLTMRYEFSMALEEQQLSNEFVRNQFLETWRDLHQLFRRHLTDSPNNNLLGYLSFFTAVDALATLDRIGPVIGIEISRDGFHRLAQMLSNEPLQESDGVDSRLREALGLGNPMEVPSWDDGAGDSTGKPPIMEERIEPELQDGVDQDEAEPLQAPGSGAVHRWRTPAEWPIWQLFDFPAKVYAASAPSMEEVRQWTAEMTPPGSLLPRVQKILIKVARSREGKLKPPADKEWFQRMVNATAWQESCFRQFVVKDKKITYLLSYNNTSVGLMQVNEKIWRGIYDLQELRWNIRYNGMAGAEILSLYLDRYVAKHKAPVRLTDEAGRRFLATWLYALYNGGPGQLKKFPARQQAGKLYKSERLFQEKYDRTEDKNWAAAVDCLPSS